MVLEDYNKILLHVGLPTFRKWKTGHEQEIISKSFVALWKLGGKTVSYKP